ncbi:hypothetical protein [Mycobacterium helveticum]|uniref:hypothetical protein n=1 Tax=Mycobacterium helveticum TaxID=2592811 RepID=UPI001AEF6331|nr:hypothetical protein [Mycobacterium helveticum]
MFTTDTTTTTTTTTTTDGTGIGARYAERWSNWFRNTAIILRLNGHTNIAAVLRHHARSSPPRRTTAEMVKHDFAATVWR